MKEFAFMSALYEKGFPTPIPIETNRHAIVMSYIDGFTLNNILNMEKPKVIYTQLVECVIRMAQFGLIHGDFNQFNVMLDVNGKFWMIDFPQMVSTSHPNADLYIYIYIYCSYFERDIKCLEEYFERKYNIKFEMRADLEKDVVKKADLDVEIKASGFIRAQLGKDIKHLHILVNIIYIYIYIWYRKQLWRERTQKRKAMRARKKKA